VSGTDGNPFGINPYIGVYGTKGVAASSNVPSARTSAISWIDSSNNLWLFGGWGYAASGNSGISLLRVITNDVLLFSFSSTLEKRKLLSNV
jgi:hypothetical protein